MELSQPMPSARYSSGNGEPSGSRRGVALQAQRFGVSRAFESRQDCLVAAPCRARGSAMRIGDPGGILSSGPAGGERSVMAAGRPNHRRPGCDRSIVPVAASRSGSGG